MLKIKEITSSVSGIIFLTIVLVFLSNIRLFPLREDEVTAFFLTLGAFLWLFIVPLLVVKFVFKNPLRDFGWRLPESWPRALTLTLLVLALFVPLMFYFSNGQVFKDFYTARGLSVSGFLLVNILMSLVYYFSEEFLFRGFMFWGLFRKIGYHSIWLSSLVFAAFHAVKPMPEFVFSFFAGLVLAYLALKTKSFIPAFVVHYIMALVLNIMLVLV